MTVTKEPGRRGEREVSRKPLRGECRVNRRDRGDYTRVLPTHCTRGCGRIGRPAFPAPSDWRGRDVSSKTRAECAARSRSCDCGCLKFESSYVVPAKAGTHSHRRSLVRRGGCSSIKSKRRRLWIPARASLGRDDSRDLNQATRCFGAQARLCPPESASQTDSTPTLRKRCGRWLPRSARRSTACGYWPSCEPLRWAGSSR